MVQQLQPGERAETRGMIVSELNGQKGTIVCYMESTGRYLLELDDTGKTLSLRKDNIKIEGEAETKMEGNVGSVDDDDDLRDPVEQMPRTSGEDVANDPEEEARDRIYHFNDLVMYRRVDGTTARALIVEGRFVGDNPTYVIRILASGVEKTTTGKWLTLISASQDNPPTMREPNALESLFLRVYENVSFPTLFVGLLAILWMWPDGSSGSHNDTHKSKSDYHYYGSYWHWPHYHYGYYWSWWGLVGGVGSTILLAVFTQKLGTNNGRRTFSWNRAWDGLLQMDLWELIRLAAIFEGALYFLGGMGARRRRY